MTKKKTIINWVGESKQGSSVASRSKQKRDSVQIYAAASVLIEGSKQPVLVGAGDFVHLRQPDEDAEPFVCQVLDLFEEKSGKKCFSVQWLYRPSDVPRAVVSGESIGEQELFYATEHIDKEEMETLLGVFRVRFLLKKNGQVKEEFISSMYADEDKKISKKVMEEEVIYECCRIYDLVSGTISLIKESKYEEFKTLGRKLLADNFEDLPGSKTSPKKEETSKQTKPATTTTTTTTTNEVQTIDSDEDSKKKLKRSTDEEKPTSSSTTSSSSSQKKKPRSSEVSGGKKKMEEGDKTTTTTTTVPIASVMKASKGEQKRKVVDSLSASKGKFTDENLWDCFQEAKKVANPQTSLEVLGYLKLESMYSSSNTGGKSLCPPPFISTAMLKPEFSPILKKVCEILDIDPNSLKFMYERSDVNGISLSFQTLEKYRPNTIFSLLGHGHTENNWLFPTGSPSVPIFGSVAGFDGFRTCRIIYQKQPLRVPIICDGTVSDACEAGFSKLVMDDFSFNLVHDNDLTFIVAPSPNEMVEQIFLKTITGKTISVEVPGVEKTKVSFLRSFLLELEGIGLQQQKFLCGSRQLDDDNATLASFGVTHFGTVHLVLKSSNKNNF